MSCFLLALAASCDVHVHATSTSRSCCRSVGSTRDADIAVQYHKNGKGKLVKCWHERIAEDYTHQDLKCPQCGQQFARLTMVRGLPANKIIGGKVIMK